MSTGSTTPRHPADAQTRQAREPLGRRFHALLASTSLANLADGIVQIGVPLYAVTLTRSPVLISMLAAAVWVPWLLLGLVGGAAVDRGDRKRMQVAALLVRAVLLAVGATLIATGHASIAVLIALTALYGVTDVVVDLAENALVPDVAPRSRLQAANGRVMAAQLVGATFVGAPFAGWLLGVDPAAMLAVARRARGRRRRRAGPRGGRALPPRRTRPARLADLDAVAGPRGPRRALAPPRAATADHRRRGVQHGLDRLLRAARAVGGRRRVGDRSHAPAVRLGRGGHGRGRRRRVGGHRGAGQPGPRAARDAGRLGGRGHHARGPRALADAGRAVRSPSRSRG